MRIQMEMLAGPPEEYDRVFFANLIRIINLALRKIDYVPVYNPDSGQSSLEEPDLGGYLKSDGSVLIDSLYDPDNAYGIIPKWYLDLALTGVGDSINTHNHTESDIVDLDKYTQAQVDSLLNASTPVGKHIDWISADELILVSGGADYTDTVIGGRTWPTVNLDATTDESFQYLWRVPTNINAAANTAIIYQWSHPSGTQFAVRFTHEVVFLGDGVDMTSVSETSESGDDVGADDDYLYQTAEISLEHGGNLVGGELAMITMKRDTAVASNLDADLRLHGIGLVYHVDSGNEA